MFDKIKKIKYVHVFCIVVLVSLFIFLLHIFLTNGEFLSFLEENRGYLQDKMFDHSEKILASTLDSKLYDSTWESFPPFAYMIYNFLYRINPFKMTFSSDVTAYIKDFHYVLQTIMVYMIIALFCFYVIKMYFKENNIWHNFLLPLSFVLSYVFCMLALSCGNSVVSTAVIMALAIYLIFYEKNGLKREIGIVLLAISFGFKLYPAIFSLELIRQKDYKGFVRFVLYSLVIFFLPFVFFGGFKGVLKYIDLILYTNSSETMNVGCIGSLFVSIGRNIFNMSNFSLIVLSDVIRYIFFAIMIILFFVTKKNYQRVLFLTAICIHFIPKVFSYNLIYYFPVICVFMYEQDIINNEKAKIVDNIVFILLAIIFSYYFISMTSNFYFIISYMIILLIVIDSIFYRVFNKAILKNPHVK